MKTASLWALCIVLAGGLVTAWVPARWPASIVEIGAFTVALGWVVWLAWNNQRVPLSLLLAVPALFAVWGGIQLVAGWTASANAAVRGVLAWSANLALVFAGLSTLCGRERRRFEAAFLWFGFALCVLATIQLYTSPGRVFWLFPVPDPQFLMGPFLNHNHYAAFVELLLPLVLLSGRARPARLAMAAALLASVIASASRAGFALVVVETALLLWIGRKERAALVSLAAMALMLAAVTGWQPLWDRLKLGEPNSARVRMLQSSLDMIRDHWVRGVGLGNWPVVYPRYAKFDDGLFANQAHNDWAQWVAEAGFPGTAAASLLLLWTLRRARRDYLAIGPLFVMIHALVDYPFQKPEIAALVFVTLAASARSPE
jgi:O-antigen ligase